MIRLLGALAAAGLLASCGVDGKPVAPKYEAETTVGYNTSSGAFNKTELGVCFGDAC